jgi:hypothetical protein
MKESCVLPLGQGASSWKGGGLSRDQKKRTEGRERREREGGLFRSPSLSINIKNYISRLVGSRSSRHTHTHPAPLLPNRSAPPPIAPPTHSSATKSGAGVLFCSLFCRHIFGAFPIDRHPLIGRVSTPKRTPTRTSAMLTPLGGAAAAPAAAAAGSSQGQQAPGAKTLSACVASGPRPMGAAAACVASGPRLAAARASVVAQAAVRRPSSAAAPSPSPRAGAAPKRKSVRADAGHSAVPPAAGLFDPSMDRDSCGVGFVAELSRKPARSVVTDALKMLERMTHRGACGCESNTGERGVFFFPWSLSFGESGGESGSLVVLGGRRSSSFPRRSLAWVARSRRTQRSPSLPPQKKPISHKTKP